jgi:hypothetical protein
MRLAWLSIEKGCNMNMSKNEKIAAIAALMLADRQLSLLIDFEIPRMCRELEEVNGMVNDALVEIQEKEQ